MRNPLARPWRNLCGLGLAAADLVLSATCAANDLTWAPGTGGDWDTTTPLFAFFAEDGVTPVDHGLTGGMLLGATPTGFTGFQFDFSGGLGLIQLYVIPEPSSAVLLGANVLLALRRRRH